MRKDDIVRRRLLAFLIDVFIVSLFVSMIVGSTNDRSDDKNMNRLNEVINDYSNEKINSKEYFDEYGKILYDINQDSFNENIIYFVVSLGYFLIFQYLNNGSTIGKKIMRIRIVNKNKKKVSFLQLLVRVSLVNQLLSMFLLLIFTKYLTGMSFLIGYGIANVVENGIVIVCGMTLVFSKDKIALHDKITNSQVIGIK
ncbi:MAG: RDD family protein [Bacilli bacterium]|nr:RDD family protein [Bacilli bacterium]